MSRVDRIDGLVGSIAVKAPVKVATTENITLEGAQTINGVSLTADTTPKQRVLVKDQTNAVENGIYDVNSGSWTRSPDFDGERDGVDGTQVLVNEGDVLYHRWYSLSATNPVKIGVDAISFIGSACIERQSIEIGGYPFENFGGETSTSRTDQETGEANFTALKSAMAFLNVATGGNGGVIFFGPGIYPFYQGTGDAQCITDHKGIKLKGSGMNTTELVAFTNETIADVSMSLILNPVDFAVEDLTFNNTGYDNSSGALSDRGTLFRVNNSAPFSSSWDTSYAVERCKFICNATPCSVQFANNVVVRDNIYENADVAYGGICSIQINSADYVVVENNNIDGSVRTEANGNVWASINVQVSQASISHNKVRSGEYSTGILVERTSGIETRNINVHDNVVDISGVDNVVSGVYFQDVTAFSCHDNFLIGGSNSVSTSGILIGCDSQDSEALSQMSKSVHHNSIEGFTRGVYIQLTEYGAGVIGVDNNEIEGATQPFNISNIGSGACPETLGGISFSNNKCTGVLGSSSLSPIVVSVEGTEFSSIGFNDNSFVCDDDFDVDTTATSFFSFSAGAGGYPNVYMARNKLLNTGIAKVGKSSVKAILSASKTFTTDNYNDIALDSPLDLNAGASEQRFLLESGYDNIPVKLTFYYTEASSADIGIDITVGRVGSAGNQTAFYTYTSEQSQSAGYTVDVDMTDFEYSAFVGFNTTKPFFHISSALNKTGAGEVLVVIRYINIEDL